MLEPRSYTPTITIKARPRRYRNLWISPELLLKSLLFCRVQISESEILSFSIKGLPDGCEVQAVHYCEWKDAFCFRLWHESFDELKESQAIPDLYPEIIATRHEIIPGYGTPVFVCEPKRDAH